MSASVITTGSGYADFKSVVAALGVPKAVFWSSNGVTWTVFAIMDNQNTVLTTSYSNSGAAPSGFSTDFPGAVQLGGNLSFG